MKLICISEGGHLYEVKNEDGDYILINTTVIYMKDQVIGKRCSQPKEMRPLTIYINGQDWLDTKRITTVRRVS